MQLISKNNKHSKLFTIGIGNGCSHELIEEGAKCGNGEYVFIADNDVIWMAKSLIYLIWLLQLL